MSLTGSYRFSRVKGKVFHCTGKSWIPLYDGQEEAWSMGMKKNESRAI